MPLITRISPQKKKGFFNVFIDGAFAFGLDAETLVKEKLAGNRTLTEEDLVRLKESSLFSKLLNSALNFLSFRPRSKKEVSRNLAAKVYKILGKKDADLASKLESRVISKNEEFGYLNDEEFASSWVEQRTGGKKPRGRALIKRELFSKGVSRETIEDALSELKRDYSTGRLIPLISKKGNLLKNKPVLEQRRKLYDFLLRRGFDFEGVKSAVDEYLKRA